MLADLENDGCCKTSMRQNSQSQSFSVARNYRCNSDEEEAGPELEKEDAELSFLMSQRWDNEPPESFSSIRQVFSACLNRKLPFRTLQYCIFKYCQQTRIKLLYGAIMYYSEVNYRNSLLGTQHPASLIILSHYSPIILVIDNCPQSNCISVAYHSLLYLLSKKYLFKFT